MSVIACRALPDVRDGLKPVQRRILYSMIELNNTDLISHIVNVRVLSVIPWVNIIHMVTAPSMEHWLIWHRNGQPRYPLVDGHGNFGSVDGDGAAAMRYTEARLSKISMEMTCRHQQNTVDFVCRTLMRQRKNQQYFRRDFQIFW